MFRKITSVLLIGLLFIGLIPKHVYAKDESINDLNKEISQLEKKNEAAKNEASDNKKELKDYENKLLGIQDDIEELNKEIESNQKNIDKLNANKKTTEDKIAQFKVEIKKKRDQTNSSLVMIQELSKTSILAALASGSSSELIKNKTSIYIILESLLGPLKDLLNSEIELNQEESKLTLQAKEAQKAELELESKSINLKKQEDEYNYYVVQQQKKISESENESESAEDELQTKNNLLDFYKSQGCGENDVYGKTCGNKTIGGQDGFIRPINDGYITNEWHGYTINDTYVHRGIDIWDKSRYVNKTNLSWYSCE